MANHCNPNLLLVTGSHITQKTLAAQLRGFLPEEVTITPYFPTEENPPLQGSYFAVFSGEETYHEFQKLKQGEHIEESIIGTRTIINQNLDKLLTLPRDQDILLVSDSKSSAMETIAHLKEIGFGFLRLIPYYPACTLHFNQISVAVTPGDAHEIPPNINSVYNIGTRLFDLPTIIRIMAYYNIPDSRLQECTREFQNILLDFAKRISNVADETIKIMKTAHRALAGTGHYAKYHFEDIIGESPSIKKAKETAEKIAGTDLSILIQGDNGTGKEFFASAIHNASGRSHQPFVAINCSALPDQLIESELFGYEEGAFTGAKKGGKPGLFQLASGGTIFLDEIGDISPLMQAKLLRVIQEKEIMKVGGDKIIPVDVRVIAATNRNLKQMIRENKFRRDLYYRLNEGCIFVPSLNQRKEDIPLFIRYWQNHAFDTRKTVDPEVLDLLLAKSWPGNIRELFNVMKFAAAVSTNDYITKEDLPYDTFAEEDAVSPAMPDYLPDDVSFSVLSAVQEIGFHGEIAGRSKIFRLLKEHGTETSEYKIRQAITLLKKEGLLTATDGKYGLTLTDKGILLLDNQHNY